MHVASFISQVFVCVCASVMFMRVASLTVKRFVHALNVAAKAVCNCETRAKLRCDLAYSRLHEGGQGLSIQQLSRPSSHLEYSTVNNALCIQLLSITSLGVQLLSPPHLE